ncbi:acyl-CoA dehydrogenase family protein [uncultured Roseibium sp.]|uniref:acyl-CoA dehydrogenase family protein n=1 Tax=uncultured Roseibium sp. TaxID=1936171 RepID=UPI0026141137|nr:acyl-CoA dehydrogenase family protein [uncultured Roseibium sp.]
MNIQPMPIAASAMEEPSVVDEVASLAASDLAPLVLDIDQKGHYPEAFMRAIGRLGAFSPHASMDGGTPDLETSIRAMSAVSEHCTSTAFCVWCQDALAWYIATSENEYLKKTIGKDLTNGKGLGGTGLSNPMKTIFGIEKLKLKAEKVDGGYSVTGTLPWVSNLGDNHHFAVVFAVPGDTPRMVMAVAECFGEGVKITANDEFVAMDGTRTFAIQFRKAFIPEKHILADPVTDYIPRIRAGFILLQSGMAFGLIKNCIELMEQAGTSLSHVNCYLPEQPDYFRYRLAELEAEVFELSKTPFEKDPAYFIRVIKARLAAGELSVAAANAAMLHCGARGYVRQGAAQRRLREAYFVAIVTPATKQLRKMLADFGAA